MSHAAPRKEHHEHLWAACALLVATVTLSTYIPPPRNPAPPEDPQDASQPEPAAELRHNPTIPTPPTPKPPVANPATPPPAPAVPPPKAVTPPPHPIPAPSPPRPSAAPTDIGKIPKTPIVTIRPPVPLFTFLRNQLGKPYIWGATGPGAYDCSGLTQTAYAKIGVHLPRTSQEQSRIGVSVPFGNLAPGDLLFWGAPGEATHVAVYIGGGNYIAAENPNTGVILYSMLVNRPDFARRVL